MAAETIGDCGRLLCDPTVLWQVKDLWSGLMSADERRQYILNKIAEHDERRQSKWFNEHEPQIDAMVDELGKLNKIKSSIDRLGDDPISQALRHVGLAYLDGKADAQDVVKAAERYVKAANAALDKMRRNPQLPPGSRLFKMQRDNVPTEDGSHLPHLKVADKAKPIVDSKKE